jgi:hypothetical protein
LLIDANSVDEDREKFCMDVPSTNDGAAVVGPSSALGKRAEFTSSSRARSLGGRKDSSALFGVGLKDGVMISAHLAKCLRRPMGLMTSLRMVDEGYAYDRCCDQLLLGISTFGQSGGSAGNMSRGLSSELQRQISSSMSLAGGDKGDGEDDAQGAEDRQRKEEEAWLDDGGHVVDIGARILNQAKRIGPLEDALQEEAEILRARKQDLGQLPTEAGRRTRPSGAAAAPSAASFRKQIPLGVRRFVDDDDDVATQLFRSEFGLHDIRRQEDILRSQEQMINALRARLGEDDDGRELLRSKLQGGYIGARSASAKTRQLTSLLHSCNVNTDKPHASPSSDCVPASGNPHSFTFHHLDSWEWGTSPSKRVLPPITPTGYLVPQGETVCVAAHLLDTSSALQSAVGLPPLACPVSFRPQHMDNDRLAIPASSPLRNRNVKGLISAGSPVVPVAQKQREGVATPIPIATYPHATEVDEYLRHTINSNSTPASPQRHEDGKESSVLHEALVAAGLRASSSACCVQVMEDQNADNAASDEAVPLWSFEREQCLKDSLQELERFYSPSFSSTLK